MFGEDRRVMQLSIYLARALSQRSLVVRIPEGTWRYENASLIRIDKRIWPINLQYLTASASIYCQCQD